MTHVIVGAMEAFLLLFSGDIGLWQMVGGCFLPAVIGNILGGTALFSLLVCAQVKREIEETPPE